MDVLSDAIVAMRTGQPRAERTELDAPWGLRFPTTAEADFHVVLRGTCWMIPSQGSPIRLGPGDVVLLPHGHGYGLADSPSTPLAEYRPAPTSPQSGRVQRTDSGAETVVLCGAYQLNQTRPHPLLRDLPEVIHLPARVGRHPSLRAAVDLLGSELEVPSPGADAALPCLIDVLLLYILRAWLDEQAGPAAAGWAAALSDRPIATALGAIHGDPGRAWTVETLGTQAGLSRAAFARRFATLIGQPPLTYLTWWRMTVAARLLRDSDTPLRAIAEQTGYATEFAFAKAFKREYGLAPGQYRRELLAPR